METVIIGLFVGFDLQEFRAIKTIAHSTMGEMHNIILFLIRIKFSILINILVYAKIVQMREISNQVYLC